MAARLPASVTYSLDLKVEPALAQVAYNHPYKLLITRIFLCLKSRKTV